MANGTHDNAPQYGGDRPLPPQSLRDAAKALASHLRQNSAMLTMPALNAIMAVEAAVEREKALPDVVADLRQREQSTYEEAEAKLMRAEKAFTEALAAITAERDKWREEANFAGTLRNQMQLAVQRSERLSEQIKGSECRNQNILRAVDEQRARAEKAEAEVSSAAVKFLAMHQRAEKAEAELATFRSFFVSAHQISDTMPAAEAVAGAQGIIDRDAGQLARLGHSTPMNVGKVLPQVVDELLRLRGEVANLRNMVANGEPDRARKADEWHREQYQKLLRAFEEQRACAEKAEKAVTLVADELLDLRRMLDAEGVLGVETNGAQMPLSARIAWLIGEWKEQPILIDRGSAKGRMASAIAADLDTARDHLQAVVGAAKVACTAMSRAWGLVGTSEQPALDAAQTTLSAAAANARHMVLDRVDPKAPAAAEPPVAPLLDAGWLQSEVERLRKANRALQEQNWDLQVPDFPMLAEPPLHLHYAYMPGDWSHKADEWFTYSRLMRNGHPTKMVRVGWRHGPGIPNSDPSVPRAAKGYAGVIERLRTAEMELARLRADAFADDCKAILEGKDAKVFTFNGKCSFKFDEPKPVPPFEGDPKACAFKEGAFDPKVGIVRDPVTGWTMDELRGQFDQSRAAVRVLAAELCMARQQIAGTKGFAAKEPG